MRTFLHSVLGITLVCSASAVGCGGGLTIADPGSVGLLPDGGSVEASVDGSIPVIRRDGGRPITQDGGRDGSTRPIDDPPCPNPPPPKINFDCDVVHQTGCNVGESCYPFVNYPSGFCTPEEHGSVCAKAGFSKQGEPCSGTTECAGGYVCVITGAGTNCERACEITKAGSCPEGLVCEALDVSGIGVCN